MEAFFDHSREMEEVKSLNNNYRYQCVFNARFPSLTEISVRQGKTQVLRWVQFPWLFTDSDLLYQYFKVTSFDVTADFWCVCLLRSRIEETRRGRWKEGICKFPSQFTLSCISLRKEHLWNWIYGNQYSILAPFPPENRTICTCRFQDCYKEYCKGSI